MKKAIKTEGKKKNVGAAYQKVRNLMFYKNAERKKKKGKRKKNPGTPQPQVEVLTNP